MVTLPTGMKFSDSFSIPVGKGKLVMINIIPKSGLNDKETKDLVKKINEKADSIKEDKKVDIMVTGSTAVNIDTDN